MADQARLHISVVALSCRRAPYLRRAVASLRAHIERNEPGTVVSWFCLDNSSSEEDRQEIRGLNWDVLVLSKENAGIGPGLNRLLSLVRSDYFLLLPDDWELGNAAGGQFLRESVVILESDPRFAQMRLDAAPPLDFADKLRCDGPFTASGGKVSFFVLGPDMPWGAFTFTPSLCRTAAFQDIGPFPEDNPLGRKWAEVSYSQRLAGRYLAIKSPDMLVFRHIGELTCPGWPAYDSCAGTITAKPSTGESVSVAVIIPTYGAFDYAKRAISTFLEHTENGMAILVDDASPGWNHDNWERWIGNETQGRVTAHHFADRGGLTRSWNWGLRKARELGADYAVAANSDILFTPSWFDGVHRALDAGWDLVGPLTNAPGPPNFSMQDVAMHYRQFLNSDDAAYLKDVAHELRRRYATDQVMPAIVNGFFQAARTSTWWANAYGAENVYDPKYPMVGNEEEFQQRLRAKGGRTGVACASFIYHYRGVTRNRSDA